jgi:ATP-binding cassette, subfamily B, multidrug efflux pump
MALCSGVRTGPTDAWLGEVLPGQTVAIVGPTGAGKTTLVNLLLRFYEIDEGTITIDDVNTRSMNRSDLRHLFGMVLQDAWLFSGTIKENIAYGREGATWEEIQRAAEAAHVDRLTKTLPEGYNTKVEDDSSNISQGERQLLTIARAFLADPQILILDEATSSVDTRTEVLIQRAMARLLKGRTSLCDCSPSLDHSGRRRDLGDERGQHHRAGHPPGTAGQPRLLLRPLQQPV